MTLQEIYLRCGGDKGWGVPEGVHSYIEVYETVLAPYRDKPGHVLEVGVLQGRSIRMWEQYYTQAKVWGIDSTLDPVDRYDLRPFIAEGTHNIRIFSAMDRPPVEEHFSGIQFNVIIDDASHEIGEQMKIYANLKDKLAPGGTYIIEDVADIDAHRSLFENIDPNRKVSILDRRTIRPRFDDVLVIIT